MIIAKIIKEKRREVSLKKNKVPLKYLLREINKNKTPIRNFQKSLSQKGINLIAEIKKASPSKGILSYDFNPLGLAKIYQRSGADALSILTDEKFFKGKLEYIKKIKKITNLPILRKDFIIDAYQVYETKLAGADAILLIASILTKDELKSFLNLSNKLGLHSLVEVHTRNDLKKALAVGAKNIGINNRSLKTFKVDLKTTKKLINFIPHNKIIVSESGINTKNDVLYLKKLKKINAILVGEALVKSKNIKKKIEELKHA
ncbi:MAG: indole-3-glycerol phosphate synthase TrpC [Candidatus Omnitrophota bacterium]